MGEKDRHAPPPAGFDLQALLTTPICSSTDLSGSRQGGGAHAALGGTRKPCRCISRDQPPRRPNIAHAVVLMDPGPDGTYHRQTQSFPKNLTIILLPSRRPGTAIHRWKISGSTCAPYWLGQPRVRRLHVTIVDAGCEAWIATLVAQPETMAHQIGDVRKWASYRSNVRNAVGIRWLAKSSGSKL